MRKTIYTIIAMVVLAWAMPVSATALPQTNKPTITNITSTSATLSIPSTILNQIPVEDQKGMYFEYTKTNQVCIAIYPTPENCLPKKTPVGQTTTTISDLAPQTSYTVTYKKDNTIRCITTPCPENSIASAPSEFTTLASNTTMIQKNLYFRSRGANVVLLQDQLRAHGYFAGTSTGYFGITTFKAVKSFQKNSMHIPPTGFVGPLTRRALATTSTTTSDVTFEGKIEAVSTACFSDGICSVTIDGKKIITTIGRSRDIVGSIKGAVTSIGDIEANKIGAKAKVFAKQTPDGYTLYGNSAYYIDVQ
jgi:hypothetical protein